MAAPPIDGRLGHGWRRSRSATVAVIRDATVPEGAKREIGSDLCLRVRSAVEGRRTYRSTF